MINKIKDFYKEPPCAEPLTDEAQISKTYAMWRMRIFFSVFFGYIVFYMCRKNIAVALPEIQRDLGVTNTELGILGSSLYFTYAFGKFLNGIIADNTNVKKVLPTALFISALMNILLVMSVDLFAPGFTFFGLPPVTTLLWTMAFFWGINGWFQSMGFPPIAKTLAYWFSNKERGVKWSLWSSSHEIGTYLSVIFSGYLVTHFGWKSAFYVPAVFAMIFCYFFYKNLNDKPSSIGLPDIEKFKDPSYKEDVQKKECEEENISYFAVFKKYILKNPVVWLLAIAYVFVYVVRYGTIDWIAKYLVDARGESLDDAVKKLSFLPLVGVLGTIGAGFVSDKLFGGKRAPVNIICLMLLALCIFMFKMYSSDMLDYVYISLIGVFTCGPQVLIGGLSAVESSSKKVASAVTGFCGMFGYIGAILSGVGTGMIIDKFSWDGAIVLWYASAFIALAICIILWGTEKSK